VQAVARECVCVYTYVCGHTSDPVVKPVTDTAGIPNFGTIAVVLP